ncbi:MAG: hypothetical protein NT051_05870 [Candidatus Micrarchaeota archaeon]|nr:hypothetical protein [Candidatus Micrarchaeota archaeon]
MASDKMRAVIAFVKVLVAIGIGYGIFALWTSYRVDDEYWYPYVAWLISSVMVFILLSKLNKGSGD